MSGIISGLVSPTPFQSTSGTAAVSKPTTIDAALAGPVAAEQPPASEVSPAPATLVDKGVASDAERSVVELRGRFALESGDAPRANRGQLRKRLNQLARAVKQELRELAQERGLGKEEELELRAAARELKSELGQAFRDAKGDIGREGELDGEAFLDRVRAALDTVSSTAGSVLAPASDDDAAAPAAPVDAAEPVVAAAGSVAPETVVAAPAAGDADDDVAPVAPAEADPARLSANDALARLSELLEQFVASLTELVESLRAVAPVGDDAAAAAGDDAGSPDASAPAREEPAYRFELELYARVVLVNGAEGAGELDASA